MKWIILSVVLALAASASAAEKYTDRYDNINVEEIMETKKLYEAYLNCILDQGRCTAEGKELKLHIQDAMQSSCEKCTDQQKKNAKKVVKHIKEKKQEDWEKVKAKYDPESKYKETYEAWLARED